MKHPLKPVDSQAYSADYYLTECEGHDEYLNTGGGILPRRLAMALEIAGDVQEKRVLDLGCGRGEVVKHCSDRGAHVVGLDFSFDALALAQQIMPPSSAPLVRADAQRLPFQDASFDFVFAFDLVEHLYPEELDRLMAEVYRVLSPGGRFVVHTMPNIWYYRYGYPLFRLVQRLRGHHLPRDPRDRWRYVKELHVNEQSVMSLYRSLRRTGFTTHVELHNVQEFHQEPSDKARRAMTFMATVYPLAFIFCNDIFGIAVKKARGEMAR
ncbi:MAG: class I SAM-dependent methyltransferase [Anaerolineae bacterium]